MLRAAKGRELWEDNRRAGWEMYELIANLSLFVQRDPVIRLLQSGILLDHLVLSEFVTTERDFES